MSVQTSKVCIINSTTLSSSVTRTAYLSTSYTLKSSLYFTYRNVSGAQKWSFICRQIILSYFLLYSSTDYYHCCISSFQFSNYSAGDGLVVGVGDGSIVGADGSIVGTCDGLIVGYR